MMLETFNISRIPSKTIKLLTNVDGVPISKSSGSQFWPILGLIMGIPDSKPFLIGIQEEVHGTSKPDNWNSYLEDFTTDMLELLQTGIKFNGVIIKVIACTKTHSGYFSCSKFIEEGDFEGRIVFLNESAPLRDDVRIRIKIRKSIIPVNPFRKSPH